MEDQRVRYLAAIGAMVVASCFLYLAPVVPQIVLDGVLTSSAEESSAFVRNGVAMLGGREFLAANLWWPGLLVLLITGMAALFTYLRGRWSAQACEAIIRRVRDRVYDHLQRLRCRYFDRAETGDLIQRCTSDVETLRNFLSTQIVEIGRALIMLLAPIPLMYMIDVRMTVVSLLCVPVIVLFSLVFFLKVKAAFKKADEAEGRMTATLQENLTGIRVVRAFARQEFEQEKFDRDCGRHRSLDYRLYVLMAWYWACSDFLCIFQKALVVGAGAYFMAIGELQVGAFYYFLAAVTMFIWPVRMMGRILTDLGKAQVALGRLREILDEPQETSADAASGVIPDQPLTGAIRFENVGFSHGEQSPALSNVSFSVEPGRSLAILGPSGCGKSTIVNLLLRLYDHDAGAIHLDSFALGELDRQFVRSQISVVMQEPFLYSKSLRENIHMARPGAHDEEIIEAAAIAAVHDSIMEFTDGYDTLVGERGVTLSGGQRQRVALARALLQEPAILILDDALSAVDNETEMMILDALREREGKHTTIIIAHRLSTVMHADHVIVLDHGRIVQSGTHEKLIAQEGLYKRLWLIQSSVEDELREEIGAIGK